VLAALGHELTQLAAELKDKPRSYQDVLLLGELSSYLTGWSHTCKQAAVAFSGMTSRAADGLVSSRMEGAKQ
jgi:hypothetical protein